jgi:3-hydroxyisobutyrate dehydrogenase-like beta-hydroxyacid dehydrogenase
MKVGFIGLGRMGQGIAGRVAGAGHDLCIYNRTADKAAALGKAGAKIAKSVAGACEGREVLITMLAHDEALEEVVRGAGGVLAKLPEGAIHVAMGTHSVAVTRAISEAHAEAGHLYVAAPVQGRPEVAATGQIGIIAAGPADALARCRPLFDVIGRKTYEAGTDQTTAAAIKLAHNMVLGCAIEALGEGFVLAEKYGVARQLFYELLTDALFACPAYKGYGKLIADEDYDKIGITVRLALKDADLAFAAAEAVTVPMPSANAWRDRLLGAIAHGLAEKDQSAIAHAQARASGLR